MCGLNRRQRRRKSTRRDRRCHIKPGCPSMWLQNQRRIRRSEKQEGSVRTLTHFHYLPIFGIRYDASHISTLKPSQLPLRAVLSLLPATMRKAGRLSRQQKPRSCLPSDYCRFAFSSALIRSTFAPERPVSNSDSRNTLTMLLANSGPITRAPMDRICASLLLRARSAE